MKIKLFIKQKAPGEQATGLFELDQDHCLIGRKHSDLRISDPSCSRQHALLYAGADGRLRLKDLESTNGTFVHGRNVADCSLRIGDEIRIGDCVIVVLDFKSEGAQARPGVEASGTSLRSPLSVARKRRRELFPPRKTAGRGDESLTTMPPLASLPPPAPEPPARDVSPAIPEPASADGAAPRPTLPDASPTSEPVRRAP